MEFQAELNITELKIRRLNAILNAILVSDVFFFPSFSIDINIEILMSETIFFSRFFRGSISSLPTYFSTSSCFCSRTARDNELTIK